MNVSVSVVSSDSITLCVVSDVGGWQIECASVVACSIPPLHLLSSDAHSSVQSFWTTSDTTDKGNKSLETKI